MTKGNPRTPSVHQCTGKICNESVTAKKCIMIAQHARTCTAIVLNFLFSDVPVAVFMVVCLSSLIPLARHRGTCRRDHS